MPDTYKKKYSSFSAKIILGCLLACFFLLLNGSITCKAETKTYTNKSTGYQVIVEDDANLLTDEEETTLGKEMAPITTYGSVAFKSIDYNPYYSTEDYIRSYYRDTFGSTSATVFLIDMDNRNIWIHSNGTIYETITKSYANTITDNVYKYASDGDYYTCAFTAFGQINTLLEGRKIAQPMKYISNAFLAVIIALLLNYFLVRSFSRAKRPSKTDLLGKVFTQCNIVNPNVRFIRQSRVYSPPSSSGSGGSSGGSILFCADCGSVLYQQRYQNATRKQDCYICGSYKKRTRDCTAHFIRTDLLTAGVTDNLRKVTSYAAKHEARFMKLLIEQNEDGGKRRNAARKKELEAAEKRISELSAIFKRLYEDSVTGRISDERFTELSADYEAEQKELKERAAAIRAELSKAQEATVNAEKFMNVVRKYTSFEELTPTLLREFVEKIVVHECSYDENGTRRQDIDIYYSFVGKVDLPE